MKQNKLFTAKAGFLEILLVKSYENEKHQVVQSRNDLHAETIAIQWTNMIFHLLKITKHLLEHIFESEIGVWK